MVSAPVIGALSTGCSNRMLERMPMPARATTSVFSDTQYFYLLLRANAIIIRHYGRFYCTMVTS